MRTSTRCGSCRHIADLANFLLGVLGVLDSYKTVKNGNITREIREQAEIDGPEDDQPNVVCRDDVSTPQVWKPHERHDQIDAYHGGTDAL
jgi:hypothetical protein